MFTNGLLNFIPLNIAEGSGKPTAADRKRFCGLARGAVMECSAILDACRVLSLADEEVVVEGKALLLSTFQRLCRPLLKSTVAGLLGRVVLRKVAPRCTRTKDPYDTV